MLAVREHGEWLRSDGKSGQQGNFEGVNLAMKDLSGVDLRRAKMAGVNLARTTLADANLAGADLRRAGLGYASFVGADLTEADLSEARATGADFSEATLTRARLVRAVLDDVRFDGADLRRASFRDASLRRGDLSGALLDDCEFQGATVAECTLPAFGPQSLEVARFAVPPSTEQLKTQRDVLFALRRSMRLMDRVAMIAAALIVFSIFGHFIVHVIVQGAGFEASFLVWYLIGILAVVGCVGLRVAIRAGRFYLIRLQRESPQPGGAI
jgi:uncharacterized protein YjbI with pentapeptide repeats